MRLYKNLLYPVLRLSDAEDMHHHTCRLLERAQWTKSGETFLRRLAGPLPGHPVDFLGLRFPNPIGIAAGFDKDVRIALGLGMLGFGHVETGTLTPRPQEGNSRPRVFRLPKDEAIINRMGFPNCGVDDALPRLERLAALPRRNFVLGVSIGKQKETPLQQAAEDYVTVLRKVAPHADYLAVNISSPNTPGLRELQGGRYLHDLCARLVGENATIKKNKPRPLLVKIAPDLSRVELDEVLTAILDTGIDGVIATNTTLAREGLISPERNEQGGLSGRPLEKRSTEIVRHIHGATGGKLPIIGVGGVSTADDVKRKLDAGAKLVQLYTGLVYEGPRMAGRVLRALA